MSIQRKSKAFHKWLMLFMGLQFVVWSFTGLFMVVMDIDYIHGDNLIRNQPVHLSQAEFTKVNYSINQLFDKHPSAESVELTKLLDKPVYRFQVDKKAYLIDADNGKSLTPISKAKALRIAKSVYLQSAEDNVFFNIKNITYIEFTAPYELNARHLPVWQVNLDDFAASSIYIGANNGLIVTKRHGFWHAFDWMFSFHVMDYAEEDVSNKLLLVFVIISLIASAFGVVLSYYKIIKPLIHKRGIDEAN